MRLGSTIAMLALLVAVAGAADPTPLMRYDDGRLTVRLEGVPLDRVVEMLEAETGVEVHGELGDWRDVTKRFDAVPLPEALDRLLGRQNFVLRYGADGQAVRVDLTGVPQAPLPATAKKPRAPAPNVFSAFATAPAVPLSPALRGAMRMSVARPNQLLRAALRQADEGIRLEAGRTFLTAVESSPDLKKALSGAQPASLLPFLRTAQSERADALLADLSRRSRDPVLRGLFSRTRTQLQQEHAVRTAGSRG
jgi:hypothetical protein